jgi:uncharacterized membrane protein YfcA
VIDRNVALRAGLIQLAAVIVIFIPLGLALPDSFFDDWGWVVGPASWLLCAMFTGRVLKLDPSRTFGAALISAIPSVIGVVLGAHQVGGLVAVVAFALLCGHMPPESRRA